MRADKGLRNNHQFIEMVSECAETGYKKHIIGRALSSFCIIANPEDKRANEERMDKINPYYRGSGHNTNGGLIAMVD